MKSIKRLLSRNQLASLQLFVPIATLAGINTCLSLAFFLLPVEA